MRLNKRQRAPEHRVHGSEPETGDQKPAPPRPCWFLMQAYLLVDLAAQLWRCVLIYCASLHTAAQRLYLLKRVAAFSAHFKVPLELRRTHSVQFAVEVAVNGVLQVTAHGRPPWRSSHSEFAACDRALATMWT